MTIKQLFGAIDDMNKIYPCGTDARIRIKPDLVTNITDTVEIQAYDKALNVNICMEKRVNDLYD